jgi:hypothetical protein
MCVEVSYLNVLKDTALHKKLYPCTDGNILRKYPTNALYMLTPLNAHCYTPTCFSPQEATLREYRHIL